MRRLEPECNRQKWRSRPNRIWWPYFLRIGPHRNFVARRRVVCKSHSLGRETGRSHVSRPTDTNRLSIYGGGLRPRARAPEDLPLLASRTFTSTMDENAAPDRRAILAHGCLPTTYGALLVQTRDDRKNSRRYRQCTPIPQTNLRAAIGAVQHSAMRPSIVRGHRLPAARWRGVLAGLALLASCGTALSDDIIGQASIV